ncbi:hypothetical protein V9T40_011314 [Parthenolecanium corni]|uniref:6-phosphofructokinase n=1 Tax=Parthenolecanium corni TaxID=536013 RepID=A0AAN9XZD3_9HEMI
MENGLVRFGQFKGQGIAVVTSGGDSQGMNPSLRAVVRVGLYVGCRIFYIKEGYQGMITGGENIVEATWDSVSSIIHRGGTIIGSARSKEFMTLEGKLKCAKNLVKRGISNLIVIGGDGSLTGARDLRRMWPDLLSQLQKSGEITAEEAQKHHGLRVVGLIGTIDNDFPGTNMTIGADSALHRILEAVNAIASTANSHRRTFILEIMGRHCGYLALKTALTTEADYVFIPEMPPPANWPEDLTKKIHVSSMAGKRLHLIVLAEGATDIDGNPITAVMVRNYAAEKLGLDARITVLGHVQRGGSPSAFDRILGSRSGAAAVFTLMDLRYDEDPAVVAVQGNHMKKLELEQCIQIMNEMKEAIKDKQFDKALSLRGKSFQNNFDVFRTLNKLEPKSHSGGEKERILAVVQIGTPACGMNAAVFSFVRHACHRGGKVYGIYGGLEGMVAGQFQHLNWGDVHGWVQEGGSFLGTKRIFPDESMYPKIAEMLNKFQVGALCIMGGYEALYATYCFVQERKKHREFCIPIMVIPATINNNVPGSEFSIGADTALNTITKTCDLFRQSAMGTKSRVFIVEIMGKKCGYLCSMGALASGADSSYIYEEPFTIEDLTKDVRHMVSKMKHGKVLRGLVLRNEDCNLNYSTDFMTRLYAEEGKEAFTTRKNILGHIQQGDTPSSFDRSLGIKLGAKAIDWLYGNFDKFSTSDGKICTDLPESVMIIGLFGDQYCNTPLNELIPYIDFENRDSKCKWWMSLRRLFKVLALHESNYSDDVN